jgi:hypothetical protein
MAEGANEIVTTTVAGVVATGFFGMMVAFINKYKGKRENVRTEVSSLSQAISAMDIALKSMRTEYDAKMERCEAEHENCRHDLAAVRAEILNMVKPGDALPMYHLNKGLNE